MGMSAKLKCDLGTQGDGSRGEVDADSSALHVLEAAGTACLSAAGHCSLMWGELPWFYGSSGLLQLPPSLQQDRVGAIELPFASSTPRGVSRWS